MTQRSAGRREHDGDVATLATLAGVVLVVLDEHGSLIRCNGATAGLADRAFESDDWRDAFDPVDVATLLTELADTDRLVLRSRLRAAGGDVWVELHGRRDGDRWVCAASDVTQQVHVDAELRRIRHVVDATSDLVVVSDLETGEVLWSNDTATIILGLAPGIPRGIDDILPEDQDIGSVMEAIEVSGAWTGLLDLEPAPQYRVPCKVNIMKGVDPGTRRETYSLVAKDISDLRAAERKLRWAANHDDLTGLANRTVLEEELELLLVQLRETGGRAGLLYCDLDRFKPINDEHGHAAGDEVLRTVGTRLGQAIRSHDLACRVGGDEFVVLVTGVEPPATIELVADRIEEAILRPIDIGTTAVSVGISIGIVELNGDIPDVAAAIRLADEQMYAVKESRSTRSGRPA